MRNRNWWYSSLVAWGFSFQEKAPPHQQLVLDTVAKCRPHSGQVWLDLGCGTGVLTRAMLSQEQKIQMIATDCSRKALQMARKKTIGAVAYICADFSDPLPFADESFDGVVAGLALSYAEHWDPHKRQWTTKGYQQALSEAFRVLKPGGTLVFSANVPNPDWRVIFNESRREVLNSRKVIKHLPAAIIMLLVGRWLKQSASTGRFHYLPEVSIKDFLQESGFDHVEISKSYAGQAFVVQARR